MTVEIALLRGINVGGTGKLPMADLRKVLERLGARDVETYIQSGNAVYEGALDEDTIGRAIEVARGFRPQVMLLSADAIRAAARSNPFPAAEADPKTLHLFFLGAETTADPETFGAHANGVERWHIEGQVFYLHTPGGLSKSKLATRIERLLGVPVTARNWSTVSTLCTMAEARA